MKVQIKQIEELVKEIAGDDTIPIVKLLNGKRNLSEFKIAERLKTPVNRIRNILYRLQAHNLVDSNRKKDRKKGWYIYYWTLNTVQAKNLILTLKKKKLKELKEKYEKEKEEAFFVCPKSCTRLKLEFAMENEFKCPDCDSLMKEDKEYMTKIEQQIRVLEKDLEKSLK